MSGNMSFGEGEPLALADLVTENWANSLHARHGESMTSVATSEGESLAPIKEALDVRVDAFGSGSVDAKVGATISPVTEDDAAFSEHRVAIVDAQGLRAMGELAASLSYLWVSLDVPGPQHRGRLGLYIEEAIELQLEKRGALPPGIQASTGLDASLSDQLYRARFVEMRGIALGIPSLEGITNLGRSLDAEDSAVLRWWIAAAADRPVHLVISNDNTKLRVYPSPVLFESLFDVAPEPVTPLPPSPSMADSSESMELSDLPPEVEQTNVLGTQVATVEELRGNGAIAEDNYYGDYDADSSEDVELPELDRALGLAPQIESSSPEKKVQQKSELRTNESPQLPLDYESPVPALVSTQNDGTRVPMEPRIASPAPPPETMLAEETQAADCAAGDFGPEDEAVPTARELPVSESESSEDVGGSGPFSPDDLAELDEDEFLRTLKEDSARAPQVEVAEENDSEPEVLGAEPTGDDEESEQLEPATSASPAAPVDPLPTKKIARNPFIRLADPIEATSEPDEKEPGEEESSIASPSEPLLSLEQKAVHVPEMATLAGAAAPDPNDPFNQLASREWKTWVTNLEAARGPKPLSVIERMFVTDYTRLREAVRRGVASPSANEILDEWQQSFSKSYSEAFDALRVRGKRPTMVLDIVEMAGRLGRLQGAKRVQLLMVDGLRFDLGLMVQDRMRQTADASLAERLLLWSALPTVTQYQLELLGKGADGLKEPGATDEPPALVARGAAARVPRRIRTGRVELFKLDVVEDCLREVGAPVLERMDSIADQTASAITEHLSKQPPRTMVVAFGDHGFALDPKKAGTTEEVCQGGSSPEEVLVPAFAWLTGAVH